MLLPACGLPFTRLTPNATVLATDSIEVPLRFSDDGSVHAEVELIEGTTVPLQLDTGSQIFVVSRRIATDLGLVPRLRYPALLRGAARSEWSVFEIAGLDRVGLGPAWFNGIDCVLLDLPPDEPGYVSFGLFADCLVTFDFPRRRLVLQRGSLPPANGRDVLEYELVEDTPRITCVAGGVPLRATIDTGFTGCLSVPLDYESQFDYLRKPDQRVTVRTINHVGENRFGSIAGDLLFGHFRARNPSILLGGQSVLLGMQLLQRFAITFDQRQRLVRFRLGG